MPKIYILDVCKHIVNLQQEIDGEIASRGGYDANTGTLLGLCPGQDSKKNKGCKADY
jgi:hypothetical protein